MCISDVGLLILIQHLAWPITIKHTLWASIDTKHRTVDIYRRESLPQNLCSCRLFLFPISFCFLSLLFCSPVTQCTRLSPCFSVYAKICPHSFSSHQCFLTHLSPLLSVHPLISPEKKRGREGIHQQKAVESYCAGGRQHVEDQTMLTQCSLTTQWMRSLRLSPTASFLPLHSLNLSISSTPLHLLFRSFCIFQSAVTLVYPAWIPLQPSKPYQPKQQQQHQ